MSFTFYFNKIKKTGILINPSKSKIHKFSIDKKSFGLLRNEKVGYKWYLDQRKIKEKIVNRKLSKQYPFLNFPLIRGEEVSYSRLLSKNYDFAEKVLNYYKKLWPNKSITPSHGDLTFANIIFLENRVEIIDWENFISKEEWGYDICYFLVSSLTLPHIIKNLKKIKNEELIVFEKLWTTFFKGKNFKYSKDPVRYIKGKVKLDKFRNYEKFFLNKLSNFQKNQIKEAMS